MHANTNALEQAEAEYGEALQIYRELAQANPQAYRPNVAGMLNNLALLHANTNALEQAEAEYGEALQIRRELAQANPQAYLPDVAMTLINYAIFHIEGHENRGQSICMAEEACRILQPLQAQAPYTKVYLETAQAILQHWGVE